MKYTVGYSGHSFKMIPVKIGYKCSKCGAVNECSHLITVKGASRGALWSDKDEIARQAKENMECSFNEILADIAKGDYRKVCVSDTCTACGEKPLWTKYVDMNAVYEVYKTAFSYPVSPILAIGFCVLCAFVMAKIGMAPIGFFAGVIILCAPLLFGGIKNEVLQLKINRLPKENLPVITLDENSSLLS